MNSCKRSQDGMSSTSWGIAAFSCCTSMPNVQFSWRIASCENKGQHCTNQVSKPEDYHPDNTLTLGLKDTLPMLYKLHDKKKILASKKWLCWLVSSNCDKV